MTTIELKNLAHAKMVEAMLLLKTAYEMADAEVANAEDRLECTQAAVIRFETIYPAFEGMPNFEADMDAAYEVHEEASRKAELLRYDADQIDEAMINLRKALNEIEDTWEYEGIGC